MSHPGESSRVRVWKARPMRDVSPFFITASQTAKNHFWNYFEARVTMREKGLKERKIEDGSLLRVRLSGWSDFIARPATMDNITMVREFYSVLSEIASGEVVSSLSLRGVPVVFTPEVINQVLNIPATDPTAHYEVVWNLEDEESRQARLRRALRELFPEHQRILSLGVTASDLSRSNQEWKKFINSRALIFADADAVSEAEAFLLHAIRDPQVDIDWGILIHREMVRYAVTMEPGRRMPFASLVARLCSVARVPTHSLDRYA